MNDLRTAAQQALEAMEHYPDYEARLIPNFAKRLNKKLERKK
jgi:hypothetical protein